MDSIGELENNMCCGTHVTNLSQLELIKVLRVEKGKKKKEEEEKKQSTLLHFIVGRKKIFYKFNNMYWTEGVLSSTLEKQPYEICTTIVEMNEFQKRSKQ
ncbi:Alanyl-tRNA editing protein Aarsd1 [Homalodisca vitripennis]|nr:Alanyl-tRNA editing protein Aarsd1 [Homalodisca vitripennis]